MLRVLDVFQILQLECYLLEMLVTRNDSDLRLFGVPAYIISYCGQKGPITKHEIHLCSFIHIQEEILYSILMCLFFDCDLSYMVRCRIFLHVGSQKASDFGAFQIFILGIFNLYFFIGYVLQREFLKHKAFVILPNRNEHF